MAQKKVRTEASTTTSAELETLTEKDQVRTESTTIASDPEKDKFVKKFLFNRAVMGTPKADNMLDEFVRRTKQEAEAVWDKIK